ncbi:hypothetical protein Syun_009844 [Stephania yunnanensis]|uniref:Uncharacterized protein n=1 Tax=Stephania yunnanensis TaxID=152371 RepID=A0AAP0KGD2_9MAGN
MLTEQLTLLWRTAIADQRDTDDQSGATGPCPVDPPDFSALTKRVAAQDIHLDKILTLLNRQLPSPSTPTVASTHDASAPTPQATSPRSTIHVALVTTVVNMLPNIASPAVAALTERDSGFDLTLETRLTRRYERYRSRKFSRDFDVLCNDPKI